VSTRPPFAKETLRYLARSDPAHRKARGQFFTPRALRDELLARLELPPRARILDPACGTGEFLRAVAARWPDAEITGWEIDPALPDVARAVAPGAIVERRDALEAPWREEFDAVVGNPPYFEFKPDPAVRKRYAAAISGRVNIYALFVQLGVELLKSGGVLAFVVSTSMTNGAFFRSLRESVLSRCRVEWLRIVPDVNVFEGVQQPVMLLVLRKGERDDGRFVFERGEHRILAENPRDLTALYEGRTTLAELGYDVRTGTVVWNQRRAALTHEPDGAVRLIWSHDIREGELVLDDPRPDRPPFVRGVEAKIGPAIVVNRVTGAGARARLRVAVVPRGMRFVAENHVNVVLPPMWAKPGEVEGVARALAEPAAVEAARRITGNTQVSATELRDLIPV